MRRLFKPLVNLEPSQSTQARPGSTVLPVKCGCAAGKRSREGGVDSPLAPGGPPPTPAVQAWRFSAGAEQIPELPVGSQLLRGTGSASSLPRPHSISALYGKIRAVLRQQERRVSGRRMEAAEEGGGRQPWATENLYCRGLLRPRRVPLGRRVGRTRGQWGEKRQDDLVLFRCRRSQGGSGAGV